MIAVVLMADIFEALKKDGVFKPGRDGDALDIIKGVVNVHRERDSASMLELVKFLEWWGRRAHDAYHLPAMPDARDWKGCPKAMCVSIFKTIEEIERESSGPPAPAVTCASAPNEQAHKDHHAAAALS